MTQKALLVLTTLLLSMPQVARATVTNTAAWNALIFQGTVSGRWGLWVEQSLRLNDGWSSNPSDPDSSPDSIKTRGNRWILRPALTYSPESIPGLVLHFGYAWLPNLSPVRPEERLWEQVTFSHPAWGLAMGHRLRLEHRFQDRTEGTGHRFRYLLRAGEPGTAKTSPWGWVLWDELFWNLNTVSGGGKKGFDQNRVFAGPQYQIDPRTRIEAGYLQVYATQGSSRDSQLNHVAALFLFMDFDR